MENSFSRNCWRFAKLPRALMPWMKKLLRAGGIAGTIWHDIKRTGKFQKWPWISPSYCFENMNTENFKNDHELVLALVSRIWILNLLHSLIESFNKNFFPNKLWFYTFAVHVVFHTYLASIPKVHTRTHSMKMCQN